MQLVPLFGISAEEPLPPGDEKACILALIEARELAAALEMAPKPNLEIQIPEPPTPSVDPNPTPTFGMRR